jgi:N-acetylmuramoyl-L-alanine amidase
MPKCPSPRSWLIDARRATAVLVVCAAIVGFAGRAAAQEDRPRQLYDRAVDLDHTVRAAMNPPSSPPELKQFRAAIAAYWSVVWRFPTSGYCDNALWQASLLAVEAFDRFGEDRDREAALSYLKMLVKEYPASGFVRRAKASIQRIDKLAPPEAKPDTRPDAKPESKPETNVAPTVVPAGAVVTAVEQEPTPDGTRIVVRLDGPVDYREERLDNPKRVFVDLQSTALGDGIKEGTKTFDEGLVRRVRVGRHPNSVTRIVLDAQNVERHSTELLRDPYRLVITCWGTTPPALQPQPVTPAPAPPVPVAVKQAATPTPVATPPSTTPPAGSQAAALSSAPVPVTVPSWAQPTATPPPVAPQATAQPAGGDTAAETNTESPTSPSSNLKGGYSLARQLGLGASRIVIDAGHGGHDPGAIFGAKTEAEITLDVALRLEQLLTKQPGIEVVLTRRTDVFIPLQERTAIANRENADLFVSIHVNASENRSARGVETYLLDFASNAEAEAIAARENASSVMTMSYLNELVKKITMTTKADESRDLATHVQTSLVRRLKGANPVLRDLGVKRAPFVVLIGASMPSILVEVAFITHRQEGRLLATPAYRQRLAESISDGVRRYQQGLKKGNPIVLEHPPAGAAQPVGVQSARDRLQ